MAYIKQKLHLNYYENVDKTLSVDTLIIEIFLNTLRTHPLFAVLEGISSYTLTVEVLHFTLAVLVFDNRIMPPSNKYVSPLKLFTCMALFPKHPNIYFDAIMTSEQ